MCLWSYRLDMCLLLLVTKTGKMSKLMASFTLEFLCRALKSFHMGGISTLDCFGLTKDFFFLWFSWVVFLCTDASLNWFGTACGSLATCFIWHTVALELSIFLTSCLTLLAKNFSKSTLLSFMVFDKIPHHAGKTKRCHDARFLLFFGVISQIDLSLHCIVPLIYASISLPEALRRSRWTHTSLVCVLQSSTYFPQIVSRLRSSFDKLQDHILGHYQHPPLQATMFLHFWHSGRATSSYSRMFSHFKPHFKNLW